LTSGGVNIGGNGGVFGGGKDGLLEGVSMSAIMIAIFAVSDMFQFIAQA
jgi:hypothetical protein